MVELIEAVIVQKVTVKVTLEDEDGMNYSFAVETKWSSEVTLEEISEEISAAIGKIEME